MTKKPIKRGGVEVVDAPSWIDTETEVASIPTVEELPAMCYRFQEFRHRIELKTGSPLSVHKAYKLARQLQEDGKLVIEDRQYLVKGRKVASCWYRILK